MKKVLFSLVFVVSSLVMMAQTNNVILVSEGGDGVCTLRSVGYGKNVKEAVVDAEKNIFKAVFFRGIAGVKNYDKPMVSPNESKAIADNQKFFDEFFDGGRYKSFIMTSQQMNKFGKNGKTEKSITVDVTINMKTLKGDLESQKVVRKFGL